MKKRQVIGQTTPSRDSDVRWIKKTASTNSGSQITYPHRCGSVKYREIRTLLPPMPMSVNTCRRCWTCYPKVRPSMPTKVTTVRKTSNIWKEHQLLDGIMRKACRNRPLTEAQTKRNLYLSKTRYVVEQSLVRCTVNSAMRSQLISDWLSECAKPSEGDVFEPVESRQQAKCARCR